jgi:hypothetical protein
VASNQQPNDAEETALAQLALQLGQQATSVVGSEPNDEELAALYENRLDTTRRAQIMGHIANNPAVYQRWIRCVETLSFMEEVEAQSTSAPISQESPAYKTQEQLKPKGFLDSFLEWISGHRAGVFGGGFATAAIALLVVFLFPYQKEMNVQQQLDDAYLSWGILLNDEWAAFPTHKKPKRKFASSRSFFDKPKSDIQQALETGFKTGVEKLGKESYQGFGIDIDNLASVNASQVATLTAEQYQALTQTGQLTSIIAIQCTMDPSSNRITNLYPVVQSLIKQVKIISDNQAQKLVSGVEAITDKNSAVCHFSDNAIVIMQAEK